jgi:uncharacterized protein DUF892
LEVLARKSIADINKHAATLRSLLIDSDERVAKQYCRGMDGLVKEAIKHITKEPPNDGELLDIMIIALYQRLSRYGVAGAKSELAAVA